MIRRQVQNEFFYQSEEIIYPIDDEIKKSLSSFLEKTKKCLNKHRNI